MGCASLHTMDAGFFPFCSTQSSARLAGLKGSVQIKGPLRSSRSWVPHTVRNAFSRHSMGVVPCISSQPEGGHSLRSTTSAHWTGVEADEKVCFLSHPTFSLCCDSASKDSRILVK